MGSVSENVFPNFLVTVVNKLSSPSADNQAVGSVSGVVLLINFVGNEEVVMALATTVSVVENINSLTDGHLVKLVFN